MTNIGSRSAFCQLLKKCNQQTEIFLMLPETTVFSFNPILDGGGQICKILHTLLICLLFFFKVNHQQIILFQCMYTVKTSEQEPAHLSTCSLKSGDFQI